MSDKFCLCFYKFIVDDSVTVFSTTVGLVFSTGIITLGVLLNYGLWTKLRIEKKKTPVWKRGNIIEPVMSGFCLLQIMFWPYDLLYLWINTNELIPADQLPSLMCNVLLILLKAGRLCISYNSFFVALVRYLYIVHWKKANQWNFERIAKIFKWTSIVIPMLMEVIGNFSVEYPYELWGNAKNCLTSPNNSSNVLTVEDMKPAGVKLTLQYLPHSVVIAASYIYMIISGLVALNITESFLYIRIFRDMKRTHDDSFSKGILSTDSYEYGNTRRMVSLKICFMSWLLEFAGVLLTLLTPNLRDLGIHYLYYFDAILMFVVIPLIHLLNDEDTKMIIMENGWRQGIRQIIGQKQNKT